MEGIVAYYLKRHIIYKKNVSMHSSTLKCIILYLWSFPFFLLNPFFNILSYLLYLQDLVDHASLDLLTIVTLTFHSLLTVNLPVLIYIRTHIILSYALFQPGYLDFSMFCEYYIFGALLPFFFSTNILAFSI